MKKLSRRLPGAVLLPAMLAGLTTLGGCMYMTHDETHAPGMEALVGQSLVTVQDAFLIKDSCIDNYDAKHCSQLQAVRGHYYVRDPAAVGGGWVLLKVPADTQALTASPELAARFTFVPKGTPLTVVQLVSRSMGQYRRCWVVYATLAALPADRVAELPACDQGAPESGPMWFHPQPVRPPMKNGNPMKIFGPVQYDFLDQPPLPDPAYLAPAPKPQSG